MTSELQPPPPDYPEPIGQPEPKDKSLLQKIIAEAASWSPTPDFEIDEKPDTGLNA